jgi:DNA-binding NtrC family response regulator
VPDVTELKRLLVIDDEPRILGLFNDVFGDRFVVETASTGDDGLAAAQRQRPDIVIVDVNMPRVTGLDVLRDLKRLDDKIPVIMITADRDIAIAEEALKNGAFAYLPKPFQIQYAEHLVAVALSRSSG